MNMVSEFRICGLVSLPRVGITSFLPPLIFGTKYRQPKVEVGWRWETIEVGKQIDDRKQIAKRKHQSEDRSKDRKSVPRSWIHESKTSINHSFYQQRGGGASNLTVRLTKKNPFTVSQEYLLKSETNSADWLCQSVKLGQTGTGEFLLTHLNTGNHPTSSMSPRSCWTSHVPQCPKEEPDCGPHQSRKKDKNRVLQCCMWAKRETTTIANSEEFLMGHILVTFSSPIS